MLFFALFSLISHVSATLNVPETTLPCNPNFPVGKPVSIGNSQNIGLSNGAKNGSVLIKSTTSPFLFSQELGTEDMPIYTIRYHLLLYAYFPTAVANVL